MFGKNNRDKFQRSDHSDIPDLIGPGLKIEGNISGTTSTLRINSQLIGNVNVTSEVIIGEQSMIKGNIHSDTVIVLGKVIGNIEGKTVVLKASANVNGDVKSQNINIEVGAKINGKMETVGSQLAETNFEAKRDLSKKSSDKEAHTF